MEFISQKESLARAGVYILYFYLAQKKTITIGKLGTFDFIPAIYAYCGSAQRNLAQRLHRHENKNKKLHWHIDYFSLHAQYLFALVFPQIAKEGECLLTRQMLKNPRASSPIKGFGSSDCKCESHLIRLEIK